MYQLVLAAALAAPAGDGYSHHQYGANYGACYGVGYTGWYAGGWGLPYGGYWSGYAGGGGCGGYDSVAYGMQPLTVASLPPPGPATYSGVDRDDKDDRRRDRDRDDKMERDDPLDKDTPLDRSDKKSKKNDKNGDDDKDDKTSDARGGNRAGRARLVLNLPADARLYVDGQYIANAAAKGSFSTPELAAGKKYYYDLRAEVIRDGKPVQQTRQVIVTAGSTVRTDFSNLGSATGVANAAAR